MVVVLLIHSALIAQSLSFTRTRPHTGVHTFHCWLFSIIASLQRRKKLEYSLIRYAKRSVARQEMQASKMWVCLYASRCLWTILSFCSLKICLDLIAACLGMTKACTWMQSKTQLSCHLSSVCVYKVCKACGVSFWTFVCVCVWV